MEPFFPSQSAVLSVADSWTCNIYGTTEGTDGPIPGNLLFTYTGPSATGFADDPLFVFSSPVILGAGTYWLSVLLNLHSATTTRGWSADTLIGSTHGNEWHALDNTGFQFGMDEKGVWVSASYLGVENEMDLYFTIYGTNGITTGTTTASITSLGITTSVVSTTQEASTTEEQSDSSSDAYVLSSYRTTFFTLIVSYLLLSIWN